MLCGSKKKMACVMAFGLIFILQQSFTSSGQLLVHFYDSSCPRAESIVTQTVNAAFQNDKNAAAKLLRLFFHDCFVGGCDGSILIDPKPGSATEKNSTRNLTIGGYEIIDAAKTTLEAVCAQTVSCADIVALAARDAVAMTGGPSFDIPTGRRDGIVSLPNQVAPNIPDPSSNVNQLLSAFNSKGLSLSELVVLSGAHTIGSARCGAFAERFSFNINGTKAVDATLDPTFAHMLQTICGANPGSSTTVPLDALTSSRFDNAYYSNLQQGKGLMTSDEVLFTDSRTKSLVGTFASDENSFSANFQLAMVKMGQIGVKTGTEGQIRRNCRVVNAS